MSNGRTVRSAGALVVAVALLVGGCTGDGTSAPEAAPPRASQTGPERPGMAGPARPDLPQLVQRLEPSVVTVLTQGGGGSGVVYRDDGLIVTNEHVVRGNERVQVAFADGQRVAGEVVATDVLVDVALVQVDREGLPVPEYRTELPEVGELAVVIGSPLGFEGTVTAGIISGLHRDIPGSATLGSQALVDLIQTDAPISPGNSGGALLDAQGRVVGLSEAYIPPSAGAVSLGFAIPAATVVRVADELLEDGQARHAYLGVQFGRLTEQIAQELGAGREGALVLAVEPGGPAEAAGAQPGDVVVAVEGERVRTVEQVLTLLRQSSPGDRLTMTVLRTGRAQDLDVRVGDRPAR